MTTRPPTLLALAGPLPLAGTAWAQGAAPARGGVLKVSANANPSSLDPATGGAGSLAGSITIYSASRRCRRYCSTAFTIGVGACTTLPNSARMPSPINLKMRP